MDYRRARVAGGRYFFTVVTQGRVRLFDSSARIGLLRDVFGKVRDRHPFEIDAIVVLPDHLHCIRSLPAGDCDFSMRWRLIKTEYSLSAEAAPAEKIGTSRQSKKERGIWQRRFWEHAIRDDTDFRRHVDYIHWNPVKHGYAKSPDEWNWSSFHKFVRNGLLPPDWGKGLQPTLMDGENLE